MLNRLIRAAAASVVLALGVLCAVAAQAQSDYPSRTVELIIPYPPGGSDTLGRKIVETVATNTGKDLVVVNVPGASTQVASRKVIEAKPDGYTLYIASPPEFVAGPVFYDDLPFDPMKDFTLISYHAEAPYMLLIKSDLPVSTYEEFVAYLKENSDKVLFGSYGALSQSDILARRFRAATGIDFEIIPYSGGTPTFNGLLAGEIQALFGTTIPTRGFIAEGQMKPLAVTTSDRSALYPEVPTLTELGVDIVDAASYGLVGPAGLPQVVVDWWSTEWTKALNDPETREFIEGMGVNIVASTPEEFRTWLKKNSKLWESFPEQLGLTAK